MRRISRARFSRTLRKPRGSATWTRGSGFSLVASGAGSVLVAEVAIFRGIMGEYFGARGLEVEEAEIRTGGTVFLRVHGKVYKEKDSQREVMGICRWLFHRTWLKDYKKRK